MARPTNHQLKLEDRMFSLRAAEADLRLAELRLRQAIQRFPLAAALLYPVLDLLIVLRSNAEINADALGEDWAKLVVGCAEEE